MKHYTFACFLALLFCSSSVSAQKYTTAIGARLGKGIGLTVQQAVFPQWTVEGILAHRKGQNLTHYALMLEHHRNLLGKRLNFYLGAGFQGAILDQVIEDAYDPPKGVAGVVGLEFTIKRLNLSFDFQPEYNITGGTRAFESTSALSLRYVLVKAIKVDRKKKRERSRAKRKKQRAKKDSPSWMFWKKDKK